MTLMFTAFEGAPMILRLYGRARVYHESDAQWAEKKGREGIREYWREFTWGAVTFESSHDLLPGDTVSRCCCREVGQWA